MRRCRFIMTCVFSILTSVSCMFDMGGQIISSSSEKLNNTMSLLAHVFEGEVKRFSRYYSLPEMDTDVPGSTRVQDNEPEGATPKTKLRGLSPQANYTDQATAACRRSYCQFFLVRVSDYRWRGLGFDSRPYQIF
jgi:hypothetical protein